MRRGSTRGGPLRSPLARGEWIEIGAYNGAIIGRLSPLARGEWIEILFRNFKQFGHYCLPSPEGSG